MGSERVNSMIRTCCALMTLGSVPTFAQTGGSRSTFQKDPSGWNDLLADSGSELKGWTRLPIPPTGELSEKSPWAYDAKTGILTCAGDQSGHEWLRWDKEQGDGILHV